VHINANLARGVCHTMKTYETHTSTTYTVSNLKQQHKSCNTAHDH